jgi:hypothetical protein
MAIMQIPNQPVGGSMQVLSLLKKFFPARQGHWGGWMFETFPMITAIDFLDAPRTKAAVHVTIGYEGATLILEKKDGLWTFKEMTGRWITKQSYAWTDPTDMEGGLEVVLVPEESAKDPWQVQLAQTSSPLHSSPARLCFTLASIRGVFVDQ